MISYGYGAAIPEDMQHVMNEQKKVCPSDPFDCHCWPPCYKQGNPVREQAEAYAHWILVSSEALNDPDCAQVLKVIAAASAAMSELHDQISQLERGKADAEH